MKVLQGQFQQGNGAGGAGFPGANGVRGGGAVSGSIIAADSSSITVKTTDGSTKIVLLSSSTTVSKVSEGSQSDLTTGQNVIVTGTTNNDGSVTATRVELGATLNTTGTGAGSGPPPGFNGSGGPSGSLPAGGPPNGGQAPTGGQASPSGGATPTTTGA